jgi:hypothetical protein
MQARSDPGGLTRIDSRFRSGAPPQTIVEFFCGGGDVGFNGDWCRKTPGQVDLIQRASRVLSLRKWLGGVPKGRLESHQ